MLHSIELSRFSNLLLQILNYVCVSLNSASAYTPKLAEIGFLGPRPVASKLWPNAIASPWYAITNNVIIMKNNREKWEIEFQNPSNFSLISQ